jgi:tight adherence protein B
MLLVLTGLCVFVAVSAGSLALITAQTATAAAARARLDRLAGREVGWIESPVALRANRMSSIKWVQDLLAEMDFARSIDLLLMRAAWNMRVSEFLSICAFAGILGGLIGFLVVRQWVVAVVLAPLCAVLPYYLLRRAAKKRIRKLEGQLVEMLVMMSNALKSGFGLMQAVDQCIRQLDPPITVELAQLRRDTQIGSSIEDAVTEFGRRVGSLDLEIVCTAILVQRNVGGNLSEILDNVAHTIRERDRIKGEIQTLIAEQKMSGYVIAAVPPVIAVIFTLLNREYMQILWTETGGQIALAIGVALEIMGAFMIKKIIDIDV